MAMPRLPPQEKAHRDAVIGDWSTHRADSPDVLG
jgi:hypothetical protein